MGSCHGGAKEIKEARGAAPLAKEARGLHPWPAGALPWLPIAAQFSYSNPNPLNAPTLPPKPHLCPFCDAAWEQLKQELDAHAPVACRGAAMAARQCGWGGAVGRKGGEGGLIGNGAAACWHLCNAQRGLSNNETDSGRRATGATLAAATATNPSSTHTRSRGHT